MVKALFDTNILIDFLNGVPDARAELARYDDAAISVVTWMEVLVGADQASEPTVRGFLSHFQLIGLDEPVAETAVQLRRSHRIRLPDAIVWATARSQGRLFVTRNIKDFPSDDPGVRAPYTLS